MLAHYLTFTTYAQESESFLDSPVKHTCVLSVDNITGVQQWNDGFPFSYYNRQTHCLDGNCQQWQVVDVNGFFGSQVYAPVDGQVVYISAHVDSYIPGGQEISILGDDGLYYSIAHVTNISVGLTARVSAGQRIGQLVTYDKVNKLGRLCDLGVDETTRTCVKPHAHFTVFKGEDFNHPAPDGGRTLLFLRELCRLTRVVNDKPEFPHLPTVNCAIIQDNPNIKRCFARQGEVAPLFLRGDVNDNDHVFDRGDTICAITTYLKQRRFDFKRPNWYDVDNNLIFDRYDVVGFIVNYLRSGSPMGTVARCRQLEP